MPLYDEAEVAADLLSNLQRAERVGLAAIGKDQTCMHTLHLWLEELVTDRLATSALDLLLKVRYFQGEGFQRRGRCYV